MYTTLDFCVLFNDRRFIVAASPEQKLHTTDEVDTAHVVIELPTARKPWYIFYPDFVQIATILASWRTDVLITSCLSPCFVKGC